MSDENEPDEPEKFVSRRQREANRVRIDTTGINIEDEVTLAKRTPAKAPKKPKTAIPSVSKRSQPTTAQSPRRRSSRRRLPSGKRAALVLMLVALLIAVPVVALEMVAAEYRRGVQTADSSYEGFKKDVLPLQKTTSLTSAQVQKFAHSADDIGAQMCRGGFLDNAAGLYPRASAALRTCKDRQRLYAALATNLYKLEADARYLEEMNAVMKPVLMPIAEPFAVIDAQLSAWQTARDGLAKLKPANSVKDAHNSLLGHVRSITEGWSKLKQANDAQDAAAFAQAEEQLSDGYGKLKTDAGLMSSSIASTQSGLTQASRRLESDRRAG